MANWYTNRDVLKDACGIPASSTGDHDQLDGAVESVSRLIDQYLGYPVYPSEQTRYLTARGTQRLYLDRPLLLVTTLRTDAGGDGSYESTWTTAMYYLAPYNATGESPPAPFWEIEVRASSTSVFPARVPRGVELNGRWGLYDQRENTTSVLTTSGPGPNATQLTLDVTGASSLHPGQTILIDSEQIFVQEVSASAAGAPGVLTVLRARNGTSGATHTSGGAISLYRYPVVEQAALYQAQQDFRAKDAPMGVAGGPFGEQRMQGAAGLHPFTRRMLDPFRVPVVG